MDHTMRVILLLLLIAPGCHKLNNRFDTVALECGSGKVDGNHYIKFLQDENSEIQPIQENLLAFHVEAGATRSSNPGQRIQVTSKGCVAIPQGETGRLDVFTKVPRQGISINLPSSLPHFSKQRLLPIKESYFGFVCPLEGYFAVDALSVPLVIPSTPNSVSERNRIMAYDESTQSEVVLYEKSFGETSVGELKLLNTSSLKVGDYVLKSTREVIDLRTETQLTSSDIATCPLTIVEKSPNLPDAILRLPASSIVPLGSKLTWTTDKPSNMKFCRKQKTGCSSLADFTDSTEVLNQEEGIWDYCFLLENRVGQKSEILCKEIRVSGTRPDINILLNSAAITTDLPVLDFPVTQLKYNIQIEHKLAKESDLRASQMCRVEFGFHGQVTLSTDSVTCLSAECRDQNLKDFVPCGPVLELDISTLYRTDLIDKAYLKLIVRADDGAGNVNTSEKTVLVDKSRWEYVPLTGPGSALENEVVQTLFPITDQQIHMLTKSNKIFEYSPVDRGWTELLDVSALGPRDFLNLETFVVMPDQTIYGLWRYSFNENFLLLRRPPGKSWELLTGANSPPGCSWMNRDFAGNLYCKYKGMAYSYSGQSWNEIPLVDSEGAELCYKEMTFALVQQTQWVYCSGRLFSRQKTDSQWTEREEFGAGFPGNIVEDRHGNIWVASDPWSDEYFVGFFDRHGQWNNALAGTSLKYQTSTIGILSLSASGDAQYGSFVWQDTVGDWMPRYPFRNPLAFFPLESRQGKSHDAFQFWDSSAVISIGASDFLFTFPSDRWDPRSLDTIDHHSPTQTFFAVIGYPGSSTERHLISLQKRRIMDWLPVVTDNQLYDEYQLSRLTTGETYFFAGQKLIYRQNPESGEFAMFRRFSDRDDVFVGTTGQIVFAYRSGQAIFDIGGGTWKEFTLPKDVELTRDQFLKDGKLWALDKQNPSLIRISADGSVQSLNLPADCYGGSSTILTHTESQVYLLGGASMCMASFDELIFKPYSIPDYSFESASTLVARLSMSRLALRASTEDSTFSILDLKNRTLSGPFTMPTDKLLNLQESPQSKQLFALYSDRVDRLVNGTWETVITSKQISESLGRSELELRSLAVDREDSFLVSSDAAPLVRIFLK